jgi:hypothetical protein
MNAALLHSVSVAMRKGQRDDSKPLNVRALARKTLLLNLGILLAGLATAGLMGTPYALWVILTVLGLVCVATWALTLVFVAFVLLARIFRSQSSRFRAERIGGQVAGSLRDEWLDGPSFRE